MKRVIGWAMLLLTLAGILFGLPYAAGGWACVKFVLICFGAACLIAAWCIVAIKLIEA